MLDLLPMSDFSGMALGPRIYTPYSWPGRPSIATAFCAAYPRAPEAFQLYSGTVRDAHRTGCASRSAGFLHRVTIAAGAWPPVRSSGAQKSNVLHGPPEENKAWNCCQASLPCAASLQRSRGIRRAQSRILSALFAYLARVGRPHTAKRSPKHPPRGSSPTTTRRRALRSAD